MPSNKDDLVGTRLASGGTNIEYGVWRSKCCGDEIVLYRGAIFPLCNRHKEDLTEWVLVSTDVLSKPGASIGSRPNLDGHPSPDRLKNLAAGAISSEAERTHLTTCNACRSTLARLTSSSDVRPKSA